MCFWVRLPAGRWISRSACQPYCSFSSSGGRICATTISLPVIGGQGWPNCGIILSNWADDFWAGYAEPSRERVKVDADMLWRSLFVAQNAFAAFSSSWRRSVPPRFT